MQYPVFYSLDREAMPWIPRMGKIFIHWKLRNQEQFLKWERRQMRQKKKKLKHQ